MLVEFFPRKIYFSAIFDFHFRENPRFRDKFQALLSQDLHLPIFSQVLDSITFVSDSCQDCIKACWTVAQRQTSQF